MGWLQYQTISGFIRRLDILIIIYMPNKYSLDGVSNHQKNKLRLTLEEISRNVSHRWFVFRQADAIRTRLQMSCPTGTSTLYRYYLYEHANSNERALLDSAPYYRSSQFFFCMISGKSSIALYFYSSRNSMPKSDLFCSIVTCTSSHVKTEIGESISFNHWANTAICLLSVTG